jgi:hypothetical protein
MLQMALKPAPLVERVAVTRHYDVLLLKIHPFVYGYDNLQQGYYITKIEFFSKLEYHYFQHKPTIHPHTNKNGYNSKSQPPLH